MYREKPNFPFAPNEPFFFIFLFYSLLDATNKSQNALVPKLLRGNEDFIFLSVA